MQPVVRKDLRFIGVSADVAQDIVSAGDTALSVFGVTKAATSVATSTVKGTTKVVKAGQSATNKLSDIAKTSAPKVREYVKDQFNYREYFAAERLRLEGIKSAKFGKYAEAEDALGLSFGKTQPTLQDLASHHGAQSHTAKKSCMASQGTKQSLGKKVTFADSTEMAQTGVTSHGVSRKIQREITTSAELDALKNPLKIRDIKLDELGRPSQRFIGRQAEVVINPETRKILSVNPTRSNTLKKLLAELGDKTWK